MAQVDSPRRDRTSASPELSPLLVVPPPLSVLPRTKSRVSRANSRAKARSQSQSQTQTPALQPQEDPRESTGKEQEQDQDKAPSAGIEGRDTFADAESAAQGLGVSLADGKGAQPVPMLGSTSTSSTPGLIQLNQQQPTSTSSPSQIPPFTPTDPPRSVGQYSSSVTALKSPYRPLSRGQTHTPSQSDIPSSSVYATPATGANGSEIKVQAQPADVEAVIPAKRSNGAISVSESSVPLVPLPPSRTQPTGITQMAAAAKRGQVGLSGERSASVRESEDHPLSDKSLRERGYHTILSQGHFFHIPKRFKYVRPLGAGAYGVVILAREEEYECDVAVKCVRRVFDQVILAKRALREITLLKHFQSLGGQENVSGLVDLDRVWDDYTSIYLYLEPLQTDLHRVLHKNHTILSPAHIQYIIYQILRGMKYVHSAHVIHRDLKPGNILLNEECEVRICDFGLARGYKPVKGEADQNEDLVLTQHVATKWYRAPEVMLNHGRYTTAIDVWSIGCILAELLSGKTLFPGDQTVEQLKLILSVLGTPTDDVLDVVANEASARYVRSLPHYDPKPLSEVLPMAEPSTLDLLSRLIDFNCFTRVDVPTALEHPWLAEFHVESDEPDCPEIFTKWEEVEKLDTIESIREAITSEIEEFRRDVREQAMQDEQEAQEDIEEEQEVLVEEEQTVSTAVPANGASPLANITGGTTTMSPEETMTGKKSDTATVPNPPTIPEAGVTNGFVPIPRSKSTISVFEEDSVQESRAGPSRSRSSSRHSSKTGKVFPAMDGYPTSIGMTSLEGSASSRRMGSRPGSRKSSMHHRRPTSSFLFGGGMTALNPGSPNQRPTTLYGGEDYGALADGVEPGGSTSSGRKPKSRAPSLAAGEFGALRPIIRGLSSVNLQELQKTQTQRRDGPLSDQAAVPQGQGHRRGLEAEGAEIGGRSGMKDKESTDRLDDVDAWVRDVIAKLDEGVAPMPVSPSDAPPSTHPAF